MTYITVYNLSINSNYRILAAKLNYRFILKQMYLNTFVNLIMYLNYNQYHVFNKYSKKYSNTFGGLY